MLSTRDRSLNKDGVNGGEDVESIGVSDPLEVKDDPQFSTWVNGILKQGAIVEWAETRNAVLDIPSYNCLGGTKGMFGAKESQGQRDTDQGAVMTAGVLGMDEMTQQVYVK